MSSRIVLRAAQMLAHSYHGGAKALSVVIDKKYQTFANELLELSGSKLGLETAVQMSMASGDLSIINAFAEQMDCVVMPRPVAPNLGMPVIQSIADIQTAAAELAQALSRADAKQGNPSATDVKACETSLAKLLGTAQVAVSQVRADHDSNRPAWARMPK